jgi:general stress protein YciG
MDEAIRQYMSNLGKKGGKSLKEKMGKDYYKMIGRMGGKKAGKTKRLQKAQREAEADNAKAVDK